MVLQTLQRFIEESIHRKLHTVEAALAEILKAPPAPEDDKTIQRPITALNPHIQPLACPPEGQSSYLPFSIPDSLTTLTQQTKAPS